MAPQMVPELSYFVRKSIFTVLRYIHVGDNDILNSSEPQKDSKNLSEIF